jgi:glycosyltransferase involved in cell wall biosynthesis
VSQDKSKSSVTKILFLSHLIESKGVFILIDACKILKDKQLHFHCFMVGGEGDVSIAQLQSVIDNAGLTEEVLIEGKQFGAAKENQFEQADIFVHPTFSDCLPLVLLEAMQYSLPIVSTFEGAIPDVVEDGKTGFLVPQKDPIALASSIGKLINNPEMRRSMGLAGRDKYLREFTLEKFESRFINILEKIGSEPK